MIAFVLIAISVLCMSSCEGRVAEDKFELDHRKLGDGYYTYTCEDIKDLDDRCCGDDLSLCKCPVRHWQWFESHWDDKCEMLATKTAECLPGDIVTTAIELGSFTTLAAALTAADLVGVLSSATELYTVFAPTDDAFALLPDGLVDCLLKEENKEALTSILLYHVVSGVAPSTALKCGQVIETLNGESVTVDLSSGVTINDSVVLLADVMASNGIIHALDSVLVPPSINVTAFLSTC